MRLPLLVFTVLCPGILGDQGSSSAGLRGAQASGARNLEAFSVYKKGKLELPFYPAFLKAEKNVLLITSFFNPVRESFKYDDYRTVALIEDISTLDLGKFNANADMKYLTRKEGGAEPKVVWPNNARFAPDGLFHGVTDMMVVVPQGFISRPQGRLSAINVKNKQEYLIHETTDTKPSFYHQVVFMDMDGDNLEDIVTVRSNPVFQQGQPPQFFGELVYYKNPGEALGRTTAWDETVLYRGYGPGNFPPGAPPGGPDIELALLDRGEVKEIVATHFFSTGFPLFNGKVSIYSPPESGGQWEDVELPDKPPVVLDISIDQGYPFGIVLDDLNKDGSIDILTTNHQSNSDCYNFTCPFPLGGDIVSPLTSIPGMVYAIERDGTERDGTTNVLLTDILPQPVPSFLGEPNACMGNSGRLAPGAPITFYPHVNHDSNDKPWIAVSGDEAGKVWILKPTETDWTYNNRVVFDINDTYGPNTTQALNEDGRTVSTIGHLAVAYNANGYAEIYIPVFEAREIHVLSFDEQVGQEIGNIVDVTLECPAYD